MVADGLAMSCSRTGVLQPTLVKWYEAMEEELNDGLCLECVKNPDLEYLAKQGVLLFNSALTTRVGTAGAHQDLWEKFTAYVLGEIISFTGVPVVFLGNEAKEFSGCLAPQQPKWELYHPVYAHRMKIKWDSGGMFNGINKLLRGANGEEIFWNLPLEDDLPF